jgi:hypothetical protein
MPEKSDIGALLTFVRTLKIQLEGFRAYADSIKGSARSSLQPLSSDLAKTVQAVFEKVTTIYAQQYASIKKDVKKLWRVRTAASVAAVLTVVKV